jgi:hypothetical protein
LIILSELAVRKLHDDLAAFEDLKVQVFDSAAGFFGGVELDVAESVIMKTRISLRWAKIKRINVRAEYNAHILMN